MLVIRNIWIEHRPDELLAFYWSAETLHDSQEKNTIGTKQCSYHLTAGDFDSDVVYSSRQCAFIKINASIGDTIEYRLEIEDDTGARAIKQGTFLYCYDTTWSPVWIANPHDKESVPTYFRREWCIEKPVKKAVLITACAGLFRVSINGTDVTEALLSPTVANYAKRCYYIVRDVTRYLHTGLNAAGVIVGDGWRRNDGEFLHSHYGEVRFFGQPCFAYKLLIYEEDGSLTLLNSDDQWTCGFGGITFSNLFDGEHFEALKEPYGFDEPGFYNSDFVPAVVVPSPTENISYDFIPPIKIQREYKPIVITTIKGKHIIDFGKNIAGFVRIRTDRLQEGTKIVLRHAEELAEDDTLSFEALRGAKATDIYIANGKEENRPTYWNPYFTYHGFRYVEVTGWSGLIADEDITALQISTDMKNQSHFECGSAILNQLQDMIVRTETNNLHGIATDCPQRDERMGWLNDATVRFVETAYNFDISAMFPKIIRDIKDEQEYSINDPGAITCTAPFIYGNRPADPVCSSFLIAGYENYMHNGDIATVKNSYAAWKSWNDCLERHSKNGIVDFSYYGDWAGPEDSCDGTPRSRITDGIMMSTGYHYLNYKLLSFFAGELGDEKEKKRNKENAERVQYEFLKRWYDPSTGSVDQGSMGALAFGLKLGILPEDTVKRTAHLLNEKVVKNHYKLTSGNLTTVYLLEELCDYGYVDTAYRVMTDSNYPGFGYMQQNGATTIWERLELKKDGGMNSHNHPMYGAAGSWFYTHLAGIQPLEPGFGKVLIAPVIPKQLLYTMAVVDTKKGKIYVKWHKKYDRLYLTVQLPFGMQGIIRYQDRKEIMLAGCKVFEF